MIEQPTVPVPGETLAEAGQRIRAAMPIRGHTASGDECLARRLAIDATLATHRVWQRERQWHTALIDGRITGVWAGSPEEAELDLTVRHGTRCHWVIADPTSAISNEYLPGGRRASAPHRRFTLGPPCRARDKFTPTNSPDSLEPPSTGPAPSH
ncbi:hypothetical protein [uncultured Microbacterium sp.]|uniref:hypothetical protein n=1 Tax=uncultured Microbacterium sp. TaxID=191216 RepID=UPI0025E9D043|nr:hypothetical protein [uncultured Microbacterium sp.]